MHDNVRPEQIALPPPPRAHPRSPTRRQLADALNPYARTATRRAIACITCARAKTRCDKAVRTYLLWTTTPSSAKTNLIASSCLRALAASSRASNVIQDLPAAHHTTSTQLRNDSATPWLQHPHAHTHRSMASLPRAEGPPYSTLQLNSTPVLFLRPRSKISQTCPCLCQWMHYR